MSERDNNVFRAKVAEQAECFEEMVSAIRKVVVLDSNLTVEERNLLSIAYKNLIGTKRTAWRIISSLHDKEKHKDPNSWKLTQMNELRESIEKQLHFTCEEILGLIDNYLLSGSVDVKARVFWNKMKGDYYRYIAEFEREEKRQLAKGKAFDCYMAAINDGKELKETDPILLGLSLNFSVFYYEIMSDKEKACEMAKKFFDAAIPLIDTLEGDDYKDTTLILQLIRDNLSLWTASEDGDVDESDE